MKTLLWLGAPSVVAFLTSVFAHLLENIHYFFLLSVAALLVAIVPRLVGVPPRH